MGKMDWDLWISRCKLLYIEWINNKVLMCSTGNYIQYLPINHNGKEYKKECVLYIYIYIYIYILPPGMPIIHKGIIYIYIYIYGIYMCVYIYIAYIVHPR